MNMGYHPARVCPCLNFDAEQRKYNRARRLPESPSNVSMIAGCDNYMYAYLDIYPGISTHIFAYLGPSMYIGVCSFISMDIYVYIYVNLCKPMCMYVYACIRMYMHVYVCLCRFKGSNAHFFSWFGGTCARSRNLVRFWKEGTESHWMQSSRAPFPRGLWECGLMTTMASRKPAGCLRMPFLQRKT